MRSRNVSPGFDVILTMISSESTRVPPVTADRSPPDSRITGADSPVIADSSTEATPSTTSPSPGTNSPAITFTRSPARSLEPAISSIEPSCLMRRRHGFRARLAQRVRLRLAAPFGHGFGKVCEKHREPQPERDLQLEAETAEMQQAVANQVISGDHRADFDDEHHRILHQRARIELDERIAHRAADDSPVQSDFFCAPWKPRCRAPERSPEMWN